MIIALTGVFGRFAQLSICVLEVSNLVLGMPNFTTFDQRYCCSAVKLWPSCLYLSARALDLMGRVRVFPALAPHRKYKFLNSLSQTTVYICGSESGSLGAQNGELGLLHALSQAPSLVNFWARIFFCPHQMVQIARALAHTLCTIRVRDFLTMPNYDLVANRNELHTYITYIHTYNIHRLRKYIKKLQN